MIIRRELSTSIQPHLKGPEAIVITGMRRTGKTTLLQSIADSIDSDNKLYLDLENPLNQKYFEEEDYEAIRYHLELKGLRIKGGRSFLFLDEIQFVKNLPSVVKYLIDHHHVKCYLTGSSSFYLKHLFSESLSGRKFIFELFPLNFREFLLLKKERLSPPVPRARISRTTHASFERLFDEYMAFGGFPGVVAKESMAEKRMALEDIFSSYFQLEVIQLGDYRKTAIIRDLMLLLMQRVGSKLDIAKIASELSVSRPTIYEYLTFLEGTYFIHLIGPHSKSKDIQLRGSPKVYCCDSGLAHAIANVSGGALFEQSIFQLLRSQTSKVYYYQKPGGAEIDFIVNKKQAYEVKINSTPQDVKKLVQTSRELGMKKYAVVSQRYSALPSIQYGFNL